MKNTKLGRFIAPLALALLLAVSVVSPVQAADSTNSDSKAPTTDVKKATGGGSVQGYAAETKLQHGVIVQVTGDKADTVKPAEFKNLQQMYGVVVDPHELSLTISNTQLKNETYVATSGTYSVLVSTQDGAIKSGDYITMSAIDGVGMKASTDHKTVFGRAGGSFDGKSNSVGNMTLKDSSGGTETVAIGLIPVAINIQRNPNDKSTKANLPEALQRLGQAIAEKPISPVRIYISMFVTGLSIVVALTTLYAGVKNAIIAIGRNPLSKKSIFRGLIEVILTGFLILIIGLFAVYLLLKL